MKLRLGAVTRVVGMIPRRVVGIVPVVEMVPVRVVEIVPLLVVDMIPRLGNTAVEKIKTKRVEQTIGFMVFIAFSCVELLVTVDSRTRLGKPPWADTHNSFSPKTFKGCAKHTHLLF